MLLLDELSFCIHAIDSCQTAPSQVNCLPQRLMIPADHSDQQVIGYVPRSVHSFNVTVVSERLTCPFFGHDTKHRTAVIPVAMQRCRDLLNRCFRPLTTRLREQSIHGEPATYVHHRRSRQGHFKNADRPNSASSFHVNRSNNIVLGNQEHLSVTLVRSLHALVAFLSPSGAYHRTSSEIQRD